MDDFTDEGILEDDIDVRHRAYIMTEKKKVIKKPSSHVILLCLNWHMTLKLVCVQVLGPLRLRYHQVSSTPMNYDER
jgi:hypothetical protein